MKLYIKESNLDTFFSVQPLVYLTKFSKINVHLIDVLDDLVTSGCIMYKLASQSRKVKLC